MNWKIVKTDFSGENVLGVVIYAKDEEYEDVLCRIARSKLAVSDENIEVLKHTSLDDLLSFDTSSRYEKNLQVVGEHSLREHFIKETEKYKEKYGKMNCIQLIEEINNGSEHIDTLHHHILLEIAHDKGIGSIAHQLLQN